MMLIINRTNRYNRRILIKWLVKKLESVQDKLPNNLRFIIYDKENPFLDCGSSIESYRDTSIVDLTINLAQVLRLYKANDWLLRPSRKFLPNKFTFRKFLLFVLYHEVSHWFLGHQQPDIRELYKFNPLEKEIQADRASLELMENIK